MSYQMMTCSGWANGSAVLGGCSMAWFSFGIIVFIAMIIARQCKDGFLAGTGFNVYAAFGLGLGANLITTFISGSARWSLILGVIGVIVGGWVVGKFMDTAGDDYE